MVLVPLCAHTNYLPHQHTIQLTKVITSIMSVSQELYIESLPKYSENSFGNCTGDFKLTVKFMVANPITHDVSCSEAEFRFDGEMTIDEASEFSLRNFSGTLEVPQFYGRTVFYKEPIFKGFLSYFQDPKMLGTLNQKLKEVFENGGVMWIGNDPRCFELEMYSEFRKNRLLIMGLAVFLIFLTVGPELLELFRTILLLKYGDIVVIRSQRV